jgi:outer membrane receptor protein involved in Fe transport
VFFNHSNSELEVTNPNNTDNAKYLAALDAVNDGGTIKCWVETAASGFQGLYPGCVPMNITTPDGMSAAAYDYVRTSTSWLLTQEMDNVGASIGGGLWGFGLPAGEITANVSVDARWQKYDMQSDFNPSEIVNCAGLRLCRASAGNGGGGNPTIDQANPPARWVQNTNGEVSSKNHVYEGALELNIPLLKEVPGFQDLSTNLAGRYTKYSSFDAVESWKIGLNWQVVDSVRFRSTLSADIRAPNLNDMFQPVTIGSTSFRDILTGGQAQGIKRFSQGNALLEPETAKTFTAGIVLTPTFMPRFSVAVDFFQTRLTNAITPLGYDQDATQLTCLASAPAYNASACDLVTRPINNPSDPNFFSQTLNLPTEIRSAPVNAALQKTKGYDLELNYSVDFLGGQFALRHLVTYQPINSTLPTPVARFYTWAVQPHWMQTTFLSYQNESWNVALQNRWLGSTSLKNSNNLLNSSTPGGAQNYVDSSLDANDVVDITIGKEFEVSSGKLQAFLTVNNLLDERAPLAPSGSGLPGLFYPALPMYDDMGRYYTAGVRMKF